jgi:hypothetical protein
MEEKILILSIVLVLGFIALRYSHYRQQRKQGHDKYAIIANGEKCPDLDMFGFKFSTILALSIFNILIVIYLCFRILKK